MRSLLRSNRILLALCLNGLLLVLVLLAVAGRGRGASIALAQMPSQPASPASGGLTVMPAQLSPNTWGCYVMDTQNQTLSVYQFSPGEHELKLAAARDIQYDRKLGFFNTTPAPTEIQKMVERAEEPLRAAPATNPSPETR